VVLAAPLRHSPGARPARKRITIYILIEHQSTRDRFMPFRLLDYVVQIYRFQARRWAERHPSLARLHLQPVLPVVLYTGTRPWDRIGTMADLVEAGSRFQAEIPALTPHFLNLPALEPGKLEQEGGFFGWVLRLWQDRKSQSTAFRRVLVRAIHHLETMPPEERLRCRNLLSCIRALVYHSRDPSEQPDLQTLIESSIQSEDLRLEVSEMGKTMADVHMAEGLAKGRAEGHTEATRTTLLRLLRRRLVDVPREVVERVEQTDDLHQLNAWFDRAITAETLEEVGILSE